MRLISQNEKLASGMQLEDVARLLRDDNLPTLAHPHDSEDVEPARSDGVARLVFVVAHERIETHIEQLGDARRIAEIGSCVGRLPFRDSLAGHAHLLC